MFRWMNYHLANSAAYQALGGKKVTNFGPDIKNSEAYACLLEQIQPVDEETKRYELHPQITSGETLGVRFETASINSFSWCEST